MNDSIQRYNKVTIILHLVVAVLIFVMFGLGWYMADLPKDLPKVPSLDLFGLGWYHLQLVEPMSPRSFYFNLHKSLGVTVFSLILLRLFWRLTHVAPEFLATMQAWEKKLAEVTHKGLYLMMLAVPSTGLVMAICSKYGVVWFGVRLLAGRDNEALRKVFMEAHEVAGWVLFGLIALHILAAIKHQVVDKDGVLQRMSLR
jgi:cytochrome b561